jgi:predicted RNA binding protein YcfA (HicA-like mRNA interferase family)
VPRITPIHWKILECIFIKAGFIFVRQTGSHRTYVKDGCLRPLVIPTYKEIEPLIIKNNMRTAKIDRETYFKYLNECR